MNALLFPGQGSQVVGMGSEFFENFEIVKKIFSSADEKLDYPLSKLILNGPETELQLTKNTQPAILTVSYSIYKVLKEEFDLNLESFKFFAGHSLGEYSALVCSESLDFLDAIYLLHERGKAMQDAVPVGQGTMIAVIGTNIKKIKELVKSLNLKKGICEIANDNADGQVIISGDVNSVEEFIKILKTNNIRCIPLKVSAPFHCSLMKPAAQIMNEKIQNVNFKVPNKEIFTNVNASPEKDPQVIKKLLVDQIFSTVRWRESIINMQNNGISNFIEIGPGKVLTGMVKRTIKNVNCFSINSIADIKNFNDKFKK